MYLFIGLIVIIAIALAVYFKYTRIHVYNLFITHYKILMRQGWHAEDALKASIDNFRYRKPFSLLSDSDLINIITALKNLNNPSEVGATLFQKMELADQDISP